MAITFQKQPLKFFNVNEPAIFEFTSDEDLGVNINDQVADLELLSLWTSRRYVIKNILPNYNTGVFRVNVAGYLKSLLLDNFDFRFDSENKKYTIERFQIGVTVRAENGADVLSDPYVFDSGYIFDETFIFAEQTPSDTTSDDGFYPTVGLSVLSEALKPQKDLTKLTILAPKYVEYCEGFDQTLSIFVGELATTSKTLTVGGVNSTIPAGKGVSTTPISDAQVRKMQLPSLITTSLNNNAVLVYGVAYQPDDCEETLQFRFFTSYGGYCYFYTPREALTANRGKTEFVNNDFYNVQDVRSAEVQRSLEYTETLNLQGTKRVELQELFKELLRSPKVEVLLPRGFTECKVTGNFNLRKNDFEYTIAVDVSNNNQMGL